MLDNKSVSVLNQNMSSTPITEQNIRNHICKDATKSEIFMFIELCKAQGLNPFLKEAYLIKYGSYPATQIVAKEVFFKRASNQPDYKGFKAGIIVMRKDEIKYQDGAFSLSDDNIVGGWAEVYKESKEPVRIEVSFSEYVGKKKDGSNNQQWAGKPGTMIRKVAISQALREAYPEQFQGMYDQSELAGITQNISSPSEEMPPMPQSKKQIEQTLEEEYIIADERLKFINYCRDNSKSDEEIKRYLLNNFGINGTDEIKKSWFKKVMAWAEIPEEIKEPLITETAAEEIPFGEPEDA